MDEMFMSFPPLQRAAEIIARLSDQQFTTLKEAVAGPEAFNHTLRRCQSLAEKLQGNIDASEIFNVLSALSFLYDHVREWEESQGRSAGILEFLEFAGIRRKLGDSEAVGIRRLTELTARNVFIERRRKLRWLRTGILDTAINFSSFLDLRPNITVDRSRIDELVPVIIFRVVVDSEYGTERSYLFQLTTEGHTKLKATIDDLDKKLALVSSDASLSGRLLSVTPSELDDDEEEEG
jgi:hypothetical protein